MLRPLAILLEGIMSGKPNIIVLSLPISMMALMLSSIPVHLEYYKEIGRDGNFSFIKEQYESGLSWLFVLSILMLIPILFLLMPDTTSGFVAIVCVTFMIEKFSDESSRALEFRKNYFGWFLIQVLRSGWVFLPITIAFAVGNYEIVYLSTAVIAMILSFLTFTRVTGLWLSLDSSGLSVIRRNIVYFWGSLLPASYRQLPRVTVVKLYPEHAHIFLALAQLAQGVTVFFNVRFQIPYRKVIARKPTQFQRILAPIMKRLLVISLLTAFVYGVYPVFIDISIMTQASLVLILLPIVLADSMVFSVLSAYLGYIQWLSRRKDAVVFYLLAVCVASFAVLILLFFGYFDVVNLSGIPVVTMIIGGGWIWMMKNRFFK